MSSLRWLKPSEGPDALPSPASALRDPNGLLAAGGSLQPQWLLTAYRHGIFPWYEEGQPILWWCPDPRAVLELEDFRTSRRLRRTLRRRLFTVTADRAFADVIDACAAPRRYTEATWITPDMMAAYKRMHVLGWAHSFEAWQDGRLAGGVYGIAIGRVFFGESMFARERDASKIALAHAVAYLKERGYALIDCQIPSSHMASLGASSLPRERFLQLLKELCEPVGEPGPWTGGMGER
ncbi:MAG TPA: leucyl/phenylalanyl-tRNA--protein transferase [Gammaproteobacteria bacterium]|jgi:leucyl/phenylalanyl-tRNA--protein transferase